MKNVTTGFPDPSQPDDQNTHDQSPFRAPRPGEGRWDDNPTPRPIPRQRDLGRPDATPPPDVVALWNKPPEQPVPKGHYYAVITRVYEDTTKNGKDYCALDFRITHGQHAGRCFEYRLWLTDNAMSHTRACIAKFGIYHLEEFYRAKLTGRPSTIFIDVKRDGGLETEMKYFDPIDLSGIGKKGGGRCGAD